jgi:uncharacterized membrane protein
MTLLKRYWLAIAFVGCGFLTSAIGYPWLPSRIAVHWSLAGQANGWMAKPIGAFILPVIALAATVILVAVARRLQIGLIRIPRRTRMRTSLRQSRRCSSTLRFRLSR